MSKEEFSSCSSPVFPAGRSSSTLGPYCWLSGRTQRSPGQAFPQACRYRLMLNIHFLLVNQMADFLFFLLSSRLSQLYVEIFMPALPVSLSFKKIGRKEGIKFTSCPIIDSPFHHFCFCRLPSCTNCRGGTFKIRWI